MVEIAGEWDYYRRRVYGKSWQKNLVAHCGWLSLDLRRTSGEKKIDDYHASAATENGKDPKDKLICAAVFVGYLKAWWSPLNFQRYGDSAVLIPTSTSSSVCFSLPTCKRQPSQEGVQLVSLLFMPQCQLTYRSRNSVEFHPKDLEWLSKDLRSLDWFNWSGYPVTEVSKDSGDNNRVSNTRYLPMIQASPTEWSILNTVLLSFLSAPGGKPVISHCYRVIL